MNKWSDKLTLIAEAETGQDADGFPVYGEPKRTDVYCNMQSVKGVEFFQAAEHGVNAVYTAVIHSYEYSGEKFAEYNGIQYAVYRAYEKQDKELTELTLADNVRFYSG
jgi:SPP1 family predicted phage head-tail adaptor